MLVLLTGMQQTGKTRWLERFVREAEGAGLVCKGLLTPGAWRKEPDGALEKTGIDALLLPGGERFPFAARRNLEGEAASCTTPGCAAPGPTSQADGARLGWRIYDAALDRANAHFEAIARGGLGAHDVLVVDELGPLELVRGAGLASALALLERPDAAPGAGIGTPAASGTGAIATAPSAPGTGTNASGAAPTSRPHAIVVVRPSLLETAKERLAPAWGQPLLVDASREDAYRGIESLISSFSSESVSS